MNLLTLDDIAKLLQMSKLYVRDKVVKRPDFPRPSVSISQKNRRWDCAKVQGWVNQQSENIAR